MASISWVGLPSSRSSRSTGPTSMPGLPPRRHSSKNKKGAKPRRVYLPAGRKFYDFYTRAVYEGGQTIEIPVTMASIPLFLPEGAIIPLATNQIFNAATESITGLHLICAPDRDGSFTLYDDEGDSYRYEQGAYTETPLTWDDSARVLTIGARQGSYPGMPQSQTYRVVLGDQEQVVTAENGQELQVSF